MNKKRTITQRIRLDDREACIYEMYRQEGCNRFVNAFKILLLRNDFYDFLKKYKEILSGNPFGIIQRTNIYNIKEIKKGKPLIDLKWEEGNNYLNSYLDKIKDTKYLKSLEDKRSKNTILILRNLLKFYYPYQVFLREGYKNNTLIFDSMLNFPKINQFIVYEEELEKHFPVEMVRRTPPFGYLNDEEKQKPRSLILICDEDTEKEELLKYINDFWGDISASLKRDYLSKKREKSSKNLIRDIEAYNTYIDTRGLTEKREQTVKKKMSNKTRHITIDNVKKAIKEISKLRKEINEQVEL